MARHQITIEVDDDALGGYSDGHLALCWHVAQANPVDIDDKDAGELAERVGREIIRRWLSTAPVELWHHQGRHYYWNELRKLGKWKGGEFVPNGAAPAAPELT